MSKLFERLFGNRVGSLERAVPSPDFVAIDVETASRNRGSICQIGIVGFRDGREVFAFDYLVKPRAAFDDRNVAIHGITAERVRAAPDFGRVHSDLALQLSGRVAVHHSPFDKQSVAAACVDHRRPEIAAKWLDSVQVARRAWPDLESHRLPVLAAHLGLELRHHDAVSDARTAGRIVLLAQAQLGLTLAELAQVRGPANPVRGPRVRRDPGGTGALSGQSIVMTGGFDMGKDALADAVANLGGQVRSTVSRKTTMLVLGVQDPATFAGKAKSSKHLEAEAMIAAGHRLEIISEAELIARLGLNG
jgi:DNA polymerase-3 subunit epsilon